MLFRSQSFFYWLYENYNSFLSIYQSYKNSKYIINLISLENDYLFNKWGIKSILMNNFIPYDYNYVIPSSLTSKTILMIGRGADKNKRFNLGIQAMEFIIRENIDRTMIVISDIDNISPLFDLVNTISLENNIKFVGYILTPEVFYKNSSLHIFPTISESFGLVLSETKIYGIPNILVGVDYVSISKGGISIIYDDTPESIAKEAIKILNNDQFKKSLGIESKNSMLKFNNTILIRRWIKIFLSIYNGDNYYEIIRKENKNIRENAAFNIIKNQINLLKLRNKNFQNITFNNILNFSYMENFFN